jgi:predicted ribosomally synthesized peptide with nif11-like leader
MPINKNEITKEMLKQALECKTAEDLIAYAKTEGIDLTKEEAEAYLAELGDQELDSEQLRKVAGGGDGPYVDCFTDCLTDCVNRYT